jgi:hypothetical protein
MDVMIEACDNSYSSITLSYGEHTYGSKEVRGKEVALDPEPYRRRVETTVSRLMEAFPSLTLSPVDRNVPESKIEVARMGGKYIVDVVYYKTDEGKNSKILFVSFYLDKPPKHGVGAFAMPPSIIPHLQAIDAVIPRD